MTQSNPLRLILTRHAKSSWDIPAQEDHERSLNPRGYRAAKRIGNWISARGFCPEVVLCSTARRARETWDGIAASCGDLPDCDVSYLDRLYVAPAEAMLETIRKSNGSSLLLVAHNPGIAHLASLLAVSPSEHPRFNDYPSGATTVYQFEIARWQDLRPYSGRISDFVIPRELR